MKAFYIFLLSEIILFPLIVGLVRLRRVKKSGYQPFFILILLGAIMELVSGFLIKVLHAHNIVPINIFILIEWLLLPCSSMPGGCSGAESRFFMLCWPSPLSSG